MSRSEVTLPIVRFSLVAQPQELDLYNAVTPKTISFRGGPPVSSQMMKELTTMTDHVQAGGRFGTAVSSSAQRNKVMRNTYWLLALSMLPTVLGAWVGVTTGITAGLTGFMGLIVFLGGAFGFMFAIEKTKNSAAGVPVLLAFTFFMGLMLSRMLAAMLGFNNGASLIMTAFGGTAGVFFVMANLSTIIKRDLSGMGKWLFAGMLAVFFGAIINVFVGSTVGMAVIATLAIAVFSMYLLYDLKRIVDGGETNYITATLGLYLSLFNIFQSLLALLGIFGGSND
jgi:modulator of FtsH protease